MSNFFSFWSLWVAILTFINIALVWWVLFANRKVAVRDDETPENRTTGHVYDGIEEYDNPLPRWWFNLFVLTIVFSVIYLILYPGMGAFKGILGWSSVGELERKQEQAREEHSEAFSQFLDTPVEELVHNDAAMKMGVRLFANNCSVCHGADGGGSYGFPNLTDDDWLYGGSPENIKETLIHGRQGAMPAWGAIIGEDNVAAVTEYVLQLSGQEGFDKTLAGKGSQVFMQNCATCHGQDGSGMISMGAPNLTDDTWLYSGTRESIAQTVRSGRSNVMPAQSDKLQEEKIHVLAAYVYSLSFDYE